MNLSTRTIFLSCIFYIPVYLLLDFMLNRHSFEESDYTIYISTFRICLFFYIPVIFLLKFIIDLQSKEVKIFLDDILKPLWMLWCFNLSSISFVGSLKMGYYILFELGKKRITESETYPWYVLFILSKIPELLDTVFTVLRSKKLVALQWYHHLATLLICYSLIDLECDQFSIFFFMNYTVHFFMYGYFGLYCVYGQKPLKKFGTFVNWIQTIQMFIAVLYSFFLYFKKTETCNYTPDDDERNTYAFYGIGMYMSYLLLFLALMFERKERIKEI